MGLDILEYNENMHLKQISGLKFSKFLILIVWKEI
jgi:hypothetical protein